MLPGVGIVIVEPKAQFAKLLAVLVEHAGGRATVVADPAAAVAAVIELRPDLVLVDLILPRTTGLALIDELRHNPLTRDRILVGLSSSDDYTLDARVRAAGGDALIRIPIASDRFATTLATILRGGKP